MKRRTPTAKRETDVLSSASDYGTAFVTARDGRRKPAPIGASRGVELTDVPDIDRPDKRVTVRVARRVDPLIAILEPRRNGPGQQRYVAAEQFRRDCAIADGTKGESEHLGVSGGRSTDGAMVALIDAQTDVRRAWSAIRGRRNEPEVADVLRLIVLGDEPLQVVEARKYLTGTAKELLLIGLDRLVDHYDKCDLTAFGRVK